MGRVECLLSSVIFLLVSSAIVLAVDNSGSINVEVRKIEGGVPLFFLVILTIVLVAALGLALFFLLKNESPADQKENGIILKPEGAAISPESYYDKIFQEPVNEIVDEKADVHEPIGSMGADKVASFLKEDERIVLNVLKMKNGSCSQATLRVVTDFSKARLSRIISELVQRGIVYKEQQGNTNIVTLKI